MNRRIPKKRRSFLLFGFTFVLSIMLNSAYGTTITLTFDDISSIRDQQGLPSNYGGLHWDYYFSYQYIYGAFLRDTGIIHSAVSGDYSASATDMGTVTADRNFDFLGVYLTGTYRDGLQIKVEGLLNGQLKYSETLTVNSTAPAHFSSAYNNIDELKFFSEGGINAGYETPGYGFIGDGPHFCLDNFEYRESNSVPEPTTLQLLGFGLFVLTQLRRKWKG